MSTQPTPFYDGAARPTDYAGVTIRKRVVGYAYPRNGNLSNPTPRYHWLIFAGEKRVGQVNRLTELVDVLPMYAAEYGWEKA
jgi:hypothetical protein